MKNSKLNEFNRAVNYWVNFFDELHVYAIAYGSQNSRTAISMESILESLMFYQLDERPVELKNRLELTTKIKRFLITPEAGSQAVNSAKG
mgnify:CR=1 FL=1